MKQGIYEVSLTAKYPIGLRLALDGKVFHYAHVLATTTENCWPGRGAVNTGTLQERAANSVVNARAIGSKSVLMTAQHDVTLNQFAGGMLMYGDADSGHSRMDPILGNTAALAGATYTVYLKHVTSGRLTALDGATLVANIFANVEYMALGPPGFDTAVGVPLIPISAGYYGWLQTWGVIAIAGGEATGNLGNQREVVFGTNGAIFVKDAAYNEGYQTAGVLANRSWYDAAGQSGNTIILMLHP